MSFYPLAFLIDRGVECLVPVDKLESSARPLLERSELPKLLRHLAKSATTARNWKQRDVDNTRLLASGSAFDLAEIVASLTFLSRGKPLLTRDNQMLEKARKLLVCEISEVIGETENAAGQLIDQALDNQADSPTRTSDTDLRST